MNREQRRHQEAASRSPGCARQQQEQQHNVQHMEKHICDVMPVRIEP